MCAGHRECSRFMPQGLCTCCYHLLACFSHILAWPPCLCQETLSPSVAFLGRPVQPHLARVIPHNLLVPFLCGICLFCPPGCWPHEVLAARGLVRGHVPVPVVEAGRQQVGNECLQRGGPRLCSLARRICLPISEPPFTVGVTVGLCGPRFLICRAWLNKINMLEVLRPVLGILRCRGSKG